MICLGNICRSPLADGLLRAKLISNGIKHITVDSCGTSGHHKGESPDKRMAATALKNGYDISYLSSRQLETSDLDTFDVLFVMDQANYDNTLALVKTESQRKKIRFYLNELYPDKNMEVPDPYFGGDAGFEHVFNLVEQTSDAIINKLKKNSLV